MTHGEKHDTHCCVMEGSWKRNKMCEFKRTLGEQCVVINVENVRVRWKVHRRSTHYTPMQFPDLLEQVRGAAAAITQSRGYMA